MILVLFDGLSGGQLRHSRIGTLVDFDNKRISGLCGRHLLAWVRSEMLLFLANLLDGAFALGLTLGAAG